MLHSIFLLILVSGVRKESKHKTTRLSHIKWMSKYNKVDLSIDEKLYTDNTKKVWEKF